MNTYEEMRLARLKVKQRLCAVLLMICLSRGFRGRSCPGSGGGRDLTCTPPNFSGGKIHLVQHVPHDTIQRRRKIIRNTYHHFSNSCAFKHSYFCGANLFVEGIKTIRRWRTGTGGGITARYTLVIHESHHEYILQLKSNKNSSPGIITKKNLRGEELPVEGSSELSPLN